MPNDPTTPFGGFSHSNGLPAIPIVLGIVGHRKIDEKAHGEIKLAVRKIIEDFRNVYQHSPIVVLSELAEGGDQLAAEAALSIKDRVYVRAPLPLDPDLFRQSTSFDNDESRTKLDRLLQDQRVEWFVPPVPTGIIPSGTNGLSIASDRQDPEMQKLRRILYANAGGYIVRHSHLLIALWDGKEGEKPSGTGDFVRFKLEGVAPKWYPWTNSEPLGFRGDRGPVAVIHTPKPGVDDSISAGGPTLYFPDNKEPFKKAVYHGPIAKKVRFRRLGWRIRTSLGFSASDQHDSELQQLRAICQSVDDFNHNIGASQTTSKVQNVLNEIESNLPKNVPFEPGPLTWLNRLCRVRAAAGLLSRRYKPRLDLALWIVFVLLFLSAVFFHLYAHPLELSFGSAEGHHPERRHESSWWALALFALFLVVTLISIGFVWYIRLDERRMDYRALAEALRVRWQWAVAGIGDSVADSYQGQLRGEMSWARRALYHICPPPQVWAEQFDKHSPVTKLELLQGVRTDWVLQQREHYAKNQKLEHDAAVRLRRVGLLLALLGWGLISSLLFHSRFGIADPKYPPHEMLIGSGLLVVSGGLLIGLRERRGHEDLAKQYERLHAVFANGLHELDCRLQPCDIVGAQNVLRALGKEAIAEHAHWLILRRARPLEIHI